ncbi:hypothetical protein BD310DRAFT_983074 [Dichomitus squalens]|uniref:Uncharacterized protein n=1 Tax=Dichomitus squalens TaxID=114155 RepID=A0A4Q9PD82_9APHY|nr:hypothetical protein BD310DRAFT_983074 [Dichomitus squalens]
MQEPTHTKRATASRKGKEREGAQPDIADRIIALRGKQATAPDPLILQLLRV